MKFLSDLTKGSPTPVISTSSSRKLALEQKGAHWFSFRRTQKKHRLILSVQMLMRFNLWKKDRWNIQMQLKSISHMSALLICRTECDYIISCFLQRFKLHYSSQWSALCCRIWASANKLTPNASFRSTTHLVPKVLMDTIRCLFIYLFRERGLLIQSFQ